MSRGSFSALKTVLTYVLVASIGHLPSASEAGVLMQGFYWNAPSKPGEFWYEELSSKSRELAEDGFTAIWLPPPLKGASGGYSNGYDAFDDYDLGSKDQRGTIPTRWGTKTQLVKAVGTLRASGLDVYIDMILAHRGGDDGNRDFKYRNARGEDGRGRFQKSAFDFHSANNPFGRALKHDVPYVADGLIKAGQWLAETLGVQGLRIDYAKGTPASFLGNYLNQPTLKDQFAVVEYWDENVDAVLGYLDGGIRGRSMAFDFPLWSKLKSMGNSSGHFNMRELVGAGLAGRKPLTAVTFVENHDTDENYPTLRNKHLGYAYILTSEGYPCVFWKDYYVYGLRQQIKNLVWIHENLAHGPTLNRWADDDLLVYERQGLKRRKNAPEAPLATGNKLLVGLNDNMISARKEKVATGFGPNVQLKDYTGNHADLTTDAEGQVILEINANSYAAYAPAGLETAQISQRTFESTQVFSGADDLDIPPASNSSQTIETLSIDSSANVKWELQLQEPLPKGAQVELRAVSDKNRSITLYKGAEATVSSQKTFNRSGDYRFEIRLLDAAEKATAFRFKITYRALLPTEPK